VRGEAKLNRTLHESPTHWRVRQQPRKKNTPCISDLAGVKFLLEKEGCFSFGVLPSKYSGSAWGFNMDSVLRKLFFGERISQNTRLIFFEFGWRKWKRRGLGRNFPFAPLICVGGVGNSQFDLYNYVTYVFYAII
jgi:hypothetical protein